MRPEFISVQPKVEVRTAPVNAVPDASSLRSVSDRAWIPFGKNVRIGQWTIRGPAYVGSRLPTGNGSSSQDNCLIDPSLATGLRADTSGQFMSYWPCYATMNPASRRAFLDWMSSARSAPGTYIGYVFIYFYGLERRAILERSEQDRNAIKSELVRLLDIYCENRSFHRYGMELLSAIQILETGDERDIAPVYEPAGGDLPPSVKIAIGRRLRDRLPIEPEWFLSWTMSHPETRVRTPARRAFSQLNALFRQECLNRFPDGLVIDGRHLPPASILYRSASGTFASDLASGFDPLPDASKHGKALALGRHILDACTERLDEYSRLIGKTPELACTLQAVALLPQEQRLSSIADLPNNPLQWMRECARRQVMLQASELFQRTSGSAPSKVTPSKLKELADILAKFGFGVVPDPRFSFGTDDDTILLFELEGVTERLDNASAHYRSALLTLALGILVANADGALDATEKDALETMQKCASGVSANERRRLAADLHWLELHPIALASLRKKLAAVPRDERESVAELLVGVASAGGLQHSTEVAILERIYRQLDLDPERLYAGLHRAAIVQSPDELVRVTGNGPSDGFKIPDQPRPPSDEAISAPPERAKKAAIRTNTSRLAAIRAETEAAAAILATVFETDSPEQAPVIQAEDPTERLEPRLTRLLEQLMGRDSWARSEFERLARELSLMSGAAIEDLNTWAFAIHDDILLEDGDPIIVNRSLIAVQLSEAAE